MYCFVVFFVAYGQKHVLYYAVVGREYLSGFCGLQHKSIQLNSRGCGVLTWARIYIATFWVEKCWGVEIEIANRLLEGHLQHTRITCSNICCFESLGRVPSTHLSAAPSHKLPEIHLGLFNWKIPFQNVPLNKNGPLKKKKKQQHLSIFGRKTKTKHVVLLQGLYSFCQGLHLHEELLYLLSGTNAKKSSTRSLKDQASHSCKVVFSWTKKHNKVLFLFKVKTKDKFYFLEDLKTQWKLLQFFHELNVFEQKHTVCQTKTNLRWFDGSPRQIVQDICRAAEGSDVNPSMGKQQHNFDQCCNHDFCFQICIYVTGPQRSPPPPQWSWSPPPPCGVVWWYGGCQSLMLHKGCMNKYKAYLSVCRSKKGSMKKLEAKRVQWRDEAYLIAIVLQSISSPLWWWCGDVLLT